MANNTNLLNVPQLQRMPKNEVEWQHFINEAAKWISDIATVTAAQAAADAAQAQADLSGHTGQGANFVWNSDTSGTMPAGNPTRDLVAIFYDEDGSQVATRTLRGSLTSASGNIAVTAQATTGTATSYTLINDGTQSVQAIVTHDSSEARTTLSWSSVDESTAGGTPASGGGK